MEERETAIVPVNIERSLVAVPRKAGYYAGIAAWYKIGFRIFLIALVLFGVLFTLFFSRAFTYDSLFYFAKDLSNIAASVRDERESVNYSYHEGDAAFGSYHGGLVRASVAGVEIFGTDGTRALLSERTFRDPRIAVSRKYVIAYDYAGSEFYVYNSYAELYHGTCEMPILGVYASDAGDFAVVTLSQNALSSSVLLYDSKFSAVQRFERSSATVGVALAENGKKIAILDLHTDGAGFFGTLDLYETGKSDPTFSQLFTGGIPVSVRFLNSKNLVVLTTGDVVTMNTDGRILGATDFGGRKVLAMDVGETGTVLALAAGDIPAASEILILDKKGNEILRKVCETDVYCLSISGKAIFALSTGAVTRISFSGKETDTVAVPTDAKEIFATNEYRVAAVRVAVTDYYSFRE